MNKNNTRLLSNTQYDNKIIKKFRDVSKLTRSVNIIPTLLLSFSGGWIMNPSISNLIHSTPFIVSNINAVLIMSLSMILNDLFDIEVDKLNNPSRPLITGEISKIEAISLSGLLFLIIEYLTNTYLSGNIQFITNLILFDILLYTPVLKKITFIKNVNCAVIVSFALFYSGLTVSDHNILLNDKHYDILSVTLNYIFWGSINNELLMDISDLDGDKRSGIQTLPVIINKPASLILVHSILFCNTMSNSLSLIYIYNNIQYGIIPVVLYLPIFLDLLKVRKSNYSSYMIKTTLNNTMIPMFLFLLYMCVLSYKL
jgi:4-hydroxybenzoate polyprenyltransferase